MKEAPKVWIVFYTMEYEGPWISSIHYYKSDAEAAAGQANQNKPDGNEFSYYVGSRPYEIK